MEAILYDMSTRVTCDEADQLLVENYQKWFQ